MGKEFAVFPSHLKRRRAPQERREELQGRATIPRVPGCLSPFQGNLFSLHCLDFQAEDRLKPRWHVGKPWPFAVSFIMQELASISERNLAPILTLLVASWRGPTVTIKNIPFRFNPIQSNDSYGNYGALKPHTNKGLLPYHS